ncbi:MAG: hypothetical protein JXQ29_10275 [Planctomycetes bacterium]|nr:hypothetical protein [Planctomycetota bacterium]
MAAAKRTAFPLLLPAAAAPPLVALLLLWLVSRRRHRFRVELQRLFGMPWKGHLPASQLRAFVLAHRALHERLEGVHGVLETVRTRSGEDDDEEAQQLDRLVRAIDQRRQHILTDVQRLASGRKGSETTLERALRIHAARMSLLDALDDLVQGLAEIHGRSRV